MAKLYTIEAVVLEVLEECVQARSDDNCLMNGVCRKLCPDLLDCGLGFALWNWKRLGLPNWKSVERCRRKIQRKRPDLKFSVTAEIRAQEEAEYREYARS